MKRGPGRPLGIPTLAGSLASRLLDRAAELAPIDDGTTWPSVKYRRDPVAFSREVLGVEPWSRQIEILEAVRDNPKVAVRSGHKIGKSSSAVQAALWFYCSFPDARVIITAPSGKQIQEVIWRDLLKIYPNALIPIGGRLAEKAHTGLRAEDQRQIIGIATDNTERMAGPSGANILVIIDEASGVKDFIFEAIEGWRAGGKGVKMLMLSNPTVNEGAHYEAFHDNRDGWHALTISSWETPNAVTGDEIFPGLATREWCEDRLKVWGENHPYYKIRVLGEHVRNEEGRVISIADLIASEQRWDGMPAEGGLIIGLDPAGPAAGGDETVFAVRRGSKIEQLYAFREQTAQAILVHLLAIVKRHESNPRAPVIVVVDREGSVGSEVFGVLRAHAGTQLQIVGVRASERATRDPKIYDRVRDELAASFAMWLKEGGAIPEHGKLSKDLHAPEWFSDVRGRLKITEKNELRKKLGRSPDYGDAAQLAVWISDDYSVPVERAVPDRPTVPQRAGHALDPYAAMKAWR